MQTKVEEKVHFASTSPWLINHKLVKRFWDIDSTCEEKYFRVIEILVKESNSEHVIKISESGTEISVFCKLHGWSWCLVRVESYCLREKVLQLYTPQRGVDCQPIENFLFVPFVFLPSRLQPWHSLYLGGYLWLFEVSMSHSSFKP